MWFCVPPYNVIGVSQIEPLLALGNIVDHTHSSNKVDHLPRGSVVEVVATLVSTVTVHPLQTELALWCCLVSHAQCKLEPCLPGPLIFTTLTEITTTESGLLRSAWTQARNRSSCWSGRRCATPPPTWTTCACAINHYVSHVTAQRHEAGG